VSNHAGEPRPSVNGFPRAGSLRARAITVVVLAAAGTTLLLAVPALRHAFSDIRHMAVWWLVLAVALEIASCLSFVVILKHFFDRLPWRLANELAWTEMGSGALLPGGGLGSLAVGGWLLHQAGVPTQRILQRSSGLFFLTSATSVAALVGGGLLLLTGDSLKSHSLLLGGPPVLAGLAVTAAAVALPLLMQRNPALATRWPSLSDLIVGITEAERALLHPSWRLLGALGYLAFDIAVLWTTLTAVGHSPPLATLILGYIIGYLANLIPVPGGIGVLEGGLVATLVLYGAPITQTTAAVLVYHAIAFWIPSLGALWAYRQIRGQLAANDPTKPTAPRDSTPGSFGRGAPRQLAR
jgi:uncharacterized membrane protein YbhN (UPF0104 family)